VIDRASTFADPKIIKTLQEKFVSVAIDQAYQRRQKDAEGEFYRKIARQGPRSDFANGTSQGLYVATSDGKFLGYSNHRSPKRIESLLQGSLDKFQPGESKPIEAGESDSQYNPKPPAGGLVLRVRAKVMGGYPETTDKWKMIFQNAISRDNLWVTSEETEALVDGIVSRSLMARIAQFHLVDNTRGEPTMWKDSEITSIDLEIKDGQLQGEFSIEAKNGKRGFTGRLFGNFETVDGVVKHLEFIAKGNYWGEGQYALGAPKGKFPVAILFSLADGSDVADSIPPQGSRGWVRGYLKTRLPDGP